MMNDLSNCETYFDVRHWAQSLPQMGDYFIWKLCDLYEVLTGKALDWEGAAPYSHSQPQKGALLIAPGKTVEQAYKMVADAMIAYDCPPWYNRSFDIQDAETICCFYNKLAKGHYTLGMNMVQDICEAERVISDTSKEIVRCMCRVSKMPSAVYATIARSYRKPIYTPSDPTFL